MHTQRRWAIAAAALAAGAVGLCRGAETAADILLDFEDPAVLKRTSVNADARIRLVDVGGGRALRVETGDTADWPGITIRPAGGRWDLARRRVVKLDVANVGSTHATVSLRVDNPRADGRRNCLTGSISLAPGRNGTLQVPLGSAPFRLDPPVEIIGMRGAPGASSRLDPSNVTQVIIFVPKPQHPQAFTVDNLRAEGTMRTISSKGFFPFIDEFGQFIHADWPGKLHSVEEYPALIAAEEKDLAAHGGPDDWDKWGGWAAGPKLQATGFFYAARHEGKWWLVDPDGRLFWSHGADCVRPWHATTPISDRRHYFRNLPAKDSPLGQFYGTGSWAPHGYYAGKGRYESYGFSAANRLRKWGEDWQAKDADLCHRRLRGWGMNTFGNWSEPRIYLLRRTAYVVPIYFSGPVIEGSTGYWGKFPDVFHPGWRAALRKRMAREKATTAGDPWCIGYFVGNELAWGREDSFARAALLSPPDQPARKAFLADLKARYGTIEALNAAWGTKHASWAALAAAKTLPDARRARSDFHRFYTRTAETFFRICREEVKRVAPDNLYLGCRFAWKNDLAIRAAAKYCDVVSFNFYAYAVPDRPLPEGIDKPVIVGEFHFGALDRGMFHTGLRPARDQLDRAEKYRQYVRGALANRYYVGTHWFQYGDQATTGRGDGENYQIGLVNVADIPYPETIRAVRDVGYALYRTRAGAR